MLIRLILLTFLSLISLNSFAQSSEQVMSDEQKARHDNEEEKGQNKVRHFTGESAFHGIPLD